MTCIQPISIKTQPFPVPCGRCAFCRTKDINSWCLRIQHEIEYSSSAYFFTLTYADEHLPLDGQLRKRDVQLWLKRLRKAYAAIRYFLIGEYGGEGNRPHYHAVIFNLPDDWDGLVTKTWAQGFISGSRAVMGRVRYMVQYLALPENTPHTVKPFRIMSRRPGIGALYVERNKRYHKRDKKPVIYVFDTPNSMPRYYRDKFWTNKHTKAQIQQKSMEYSEKFGLPPCPVDHERKLKRLNKKQR